MQKGICEICGKATAPTYHYCNACFMDMDEHLKPRKGKSFTAEDRERARNSVFRNRAARYMKKGANKSPWPRDTMILPKRVQKCPVCNRLTLGHGIFCTDHYQMLPIEATPETNYVLSKREYAIAMQWFHDNGVPMHKPWVKRRG